MADTKVSALTDGATIDAGDRIPVARAPYGPTDNRYVVRGYFKTFFDTLYDALGAAAAAVAGHEAAGDPHPQYLTPAEGDALFLTPAEGDAAYSAKLHAATHQPGGSDAMAVDAAAATGSLRTLGAGALQAASGTDARFTDARTPLAHKVSHQDGGADEISVLGLSGLLADAQTPLAHAVTHKAGGTDPIKLDELAAPTDILTLNADATKHGLMQKYPGGTTTFLRADGTFAAPTASVAFTEFTKDLGAARTSGSFDITGLSGLTVDKPVKVFQTAAKITSKGDSRDESEMDHIDVTGYVLDAATIRCYWNSINVVVGTYAFAYLVGA